MPASRTPRTARVASGLSWRQHGRMLEPVPLSVIGPRARAPQARRRARLMLVLPLSGTDRSRASSVPSKGAIALQRLSSGATRCSSRDMARLAW